MSLEEFANRDASTLVPKRRASIVDAIVVSSTDAACDFRRFRRFAGLVSQVYGSSYGGYLTPSERAEYGDLHFEAEAVVGLYLDAFASAGRWDEGNLWKKWAQEASEVAEALAALAIKMRRGVDEEAIRRRLALASMARDVGLPEDETHAVDRAFDDGGELDAFEVLCSCLFADGVSLTRGQAALLASVGARIGADPHLWKMVMVEPADEVCAEARRNADETQSVSL